MSANNRDVSTLTMFVDVLFDEPATALRLACVAFIVTGIVGLKLVRP